MDLPLQNHLAYNREVPSLLERKQLLILRSRTTPCASRYAACAMRHALAASSPNRSHLTNSESRVFSGDMYEELPENPKLVGGSEAGKEDL